MSAPAPTTTAAGTPFDPRTARAVMIVLAGMALMVTYVETMVLPAFKAFTLFFNYPPPSTVVWIVAAYLLVGTVATPVFGKLGDKYGKKRMLLVVMALYTVAVSVAGFTPEIGAALGVDRANQLYLLIGARAFQGLGMGMFPLAFAMLPEVFPAARVGQAQGIVSGMFAAGAALGLVGGGYLTVAFGWQLTYHTVTPISLALVVVAYYVLRESPNLSPKPIDFLGIGSLGIALATAMLGLTEGAYWGWTNVAAVRYGGVPWGVPELFLLAAAATAIFLLWEPRAPVPVVSFRALKQRNIWISNANGVIAGIAMFLVFVTMTFLLEEQFAPGFNLDGFQMGLAALPSALGMLATAPRWGHLVARAGPKPVMLAGFSLVVLGAGGLLVLHATIVELSILMIPTLVGNVAVLIAMSNIIVLSVAPNELGIQTGMNQTFRNLGSAIGPVIVATVAASYATATGPSITAYELLFALTASVAAVGGLLALGLRNYKFHADGRRAEASVPTPGAPGPEPATPAATAPRA